MNYVTLQVPEHLYLQTLAFVAAEHDEFLASAELVRENELLRKIAQDQSEEIGRLRELYSNATTAAPL